MTTETSRRRARLAPTPKVSAPAAGSDQRPVARVVAMPTLGSLPGAPNPQGPAAKCEPTPILVSLLDPALCLAADVLDDIERVRVANENRVRQLTRTEADSDGEERGFGLDPSHPDVVQLVRTVEALKAMEHDATLELQRRLRRHPLGAWVKATKGVGEKQGARLLAAIGDPYINSAVGAPRTVSALWAYAGLHVLHDTDHRELDAQRRPVGVVDQLPAGRIGVDAQTDGAGGVQHRDTDHDDVDAHSAPVGVAAKRRKGQRANWSTKAKMRAHLIAESCIKQLSPDCRDGHTGLDAQRTPAVPAPSPADRTGHQPNDTHRNLAGPVCGCSPYRVVYDQRRAHTALTHPEWTDGHSHNDALRVASKAILKDLWRAARDWHSAQAAGVPDPGL